jgi:hypothetical protein
MSFPRLRQISLLTLAVSIAACSQKPQNSEFVLLPDEIRETSALLCLNNGHFLTLNDSGHPSVLFEFDRQGRILQRTPLAVSNTDWEALAQSPTQLWVGDLGNNSGARQQTQLWQLTQPWQQAQTPVEVPIRLTHQQQPMPAPYQHDLDVEALTYADGALWLFSKSWQSGLSQVYRWRAGEALQTAGVVQGLKGLVTDAAFSETEQLFVLVGYSNMYKNPLSFLLNNDYQPFIALVDRNFQLVMQQPLNSTGQVEGVCVDQQQQIWLTQEKTEAQPALFWRFSSVQELRKKTNIKS